MRVRLCVDLQALNRPPSAPEQVHYQKNYGEKQQQVDSASRDVECRPTDQPHSQENEKQHQKKKIADHFFIPHAGLSTPFSKLKVAVPTRFQRVE
jgi:hypothetical protein